MFLATPYMVCTRVDTAEPELDQDEALLCLHGAAEAQPHPIGVPKVGLLRLVDRRVQLSGGCTPDRTKGRVPPPRWGAFHLLDDNTLYQRTDVTLELLLSRVHGPYHGAKEY